VLFGQSVLNDNFDECVVFVEGEVITDSSSEVAIDGLAGLAGDLARECSGPYILKYYLLWYILNSISNSI
jgi:hypothetical protein